MSYRALYRVWRPQRFADLIGQEHVTRTLMNALEEGHFSHAYLFSGPRGTGKTSAAKIMAKAVNCQRGPAREPCNECEACRRITEGSLMDVVEIDAASNRGVDEIRDLRDKVKYAPTEVRYKVYIIDEVHMLTTEAFNALLKTLEEPPGHVIFILATTEPHKLPSTILSRCQRFAFRRLSLNHITERMRFICESQGIRADGEALKAIARAAEGGMRDALSLLDQVLAFGGDRVDETSVMAVTGSTSRKGLAEILQSISEGDTLRTLERIDRWMADGLEPERLVQDLIHACRDLLLVLTVPELPEVKERLSEDEGWTHLARQFSAEGLGEMLDRLIHTQQQMKWAAHPRILLEMTAVRLCNPEKRSGKSPSGDAGDESVILRLKQQVERLERQVSELSRRLGGEDAMNRPEEATGDSPSASLRKADRPVRNTGLSGRIPAMLEHASAEELKRVRQQWPEVLARVKDQKITVHAWLIDGEPVAASKDAVLLAFKNTIHRETTEKEVNKSLIQQVMAEVFGTPKTLYTLMRGEWERIQTVTETSASVTESAGEPSPTEDPVQRAVELFGEDLVEITD